MAFGKKETKSTCHRYKSKDKATKRRKLSKNRVKKNKIEKIYKKFSRREDSTGS